MPIGLELAAGLGVELVSYATSSVHFDYGDGPKKTAWVGPSSALLGIDANGDGLITGSKIVFTDWAPGAKTDFEALLMAFDTNNDQIFDARDEQFEKFLIWQDKNQNGISEANELRSLAGAGLEKIDFQDWNAGAADLPTASGILGAASIHWTDGSVTKAYDLAFECEV